MTKGFFAIGLMSGTSADGVDAALLYTDGEYHIEPIDFTFRPYDQDLKTTLRALCSHQRTHGPKLERAQTRLIQAHIAAIDQLLEQTDLKNIDIIGFHGHTLGHQPQAGWSWQIGDAQALADYYQTDVIADFRDNDIAHGGQGAPLTPLFHQALIHGTSPYRVAVLNIGGIANVTIISSDQDPIAFDTGPGNAMIDQWIRAVNGQEYDKNGALAAQGQVDQEFIDKCLNDPWFSRSAPKSLDRLDLDRFMPSALSASNGAATLTSLTAEAVAQALKRLEKPPNLVGATGGGRHNLTLMKMLAKHLAPIDLVGGETLGWHVDALEAQAFAWLAVRSRQGKPISLPSTTGVSHPLSGGNLYRYRKNP